MNGANLPAARDELVISCITQGSATVREGSDGRSQFMIRGELQDTTDLTRIGTFRGVFQTKIFSKSDLFDYPEPPERVFDRPYRFGEKEWSPLLNPAKCEWSFDDPKYVVTGVGMGLSRIAVDPSRGAQFWYSLNSFLHAYDGDEHVSLGEAASVATAHFPATPSLVEGMSFPLNVFHTLSMVPRAQQ